MKYSRLLASSCLLVLLSIATTAQADLVITVTENVTSGGTNWSFSDGSGVISGSGNHFLVGATAANPQPFHSSDGEDTDGLTVLAGSNVFNIVNIFVRDYGNLSGTNGNIHDGVDFQTTGSVGGSSIDLLNGLILHANDLDISSLNQGVYTLDSYYSGYGTELGTVTLNVNEALVTPAAAIPAMSTWGLVMLIGLLFMVGVKRRFT